MLNRSCGVSEGHVLTTSLLIFNCLKIINMDEFLVKGIQFVSDWLKASNLPNLVDVFEGMYRGIH